MQTTEELKKLLYKNETVADTAPDALSAAQEFCEGYKAFLDHGKTEREVTAYSEKLLLNAGYKPFVAGEKLSAVTRCTPSTGKSVFWRPPSEPSRWRKVST